MADPPRERRTRPSGHPSGCHGEGKPCCLIRPASPTGRQGTRGAGRKYRQLAAPERGVFTERARVDSSSSGLGSPRRFRGCRASVSGHPCGCHGGASRADLYPPPIPSSILGYPAPRGRRGASRGGRGGGVAALSPAVVARGGGGTDEEALHGAYPPGYRRRARWGSSIWTRRGEAPSERPQPTLTGCTALRVELAGCRGGAPPVRPGMGLVRPRVRSVGGRPIAARLPAHAHAPAGAVFDRPGALTPLGAAWQPDERRRMKHA